MGAAARRRVRTEAARFSRHHRADQLSLEEWQAGLRRQYGREQPFLLENVGSDDVRLLWLNESYHVATLDNDKDRIVQRAGRFIEEIGGHRRA